MIHRPFGKTGLKLPPLVIGTSSLGNLYQAYDDATKLAIMRACHQHIPTPMVLDSAGKYGAGMALEYIGKTLRELHVPPADVIISNKLGWRRIPLRGSEATFEPGAWFGLDHDAESAISFQGILDCWEQGCRLLGHPYRPQLASVHDPDEYLAADPENEAARWQDLLDAYKALAELKAAGEIAGIGVGAKDWRIIQRLHQAVDLDWVMLACSLSIYTHPPELIEFVAELDAQGIGVINSAVFNAGFLVGGRYFDYRIPDPETDPELFAWRERFHQLCEAHDVSPAAACVHFALNVPGVDAVALNTSKPERVAQNVALVETDVPERFYAALAEASERQDSDSRP